MIKVKVQGLDTLIAKTNVKLLTKGIRTGMKKSLIFLYKTAIPETPIDTGILRKGYRKKLTGLRGKLYNRTAYARYVSDGTKFQKANPFLRNIKEKAEERIDTIINNEIKKQLG